MNEIKRATPEYPIHELLARRFSPYGFSDRAVSKADLLSLFEAARWAASSYNEQPWTYILATREQPEEFARVLECLVEGNRAWAKDAPVLAIGCTNLNHAKNGKRNPAAIHDLGLASANLAIEATARGLCVHQMIGVMHDKVREVFKVPEDVQPLTGIAIGHAADPNMEPEPLRKKDTTPRSRKALAEMVFGGQWGTKSGIV